MSRFSGTKGRRNRNSVFQLPDQGVMRRLLAGAHRRLLPQGKPMGPILERILFETIYGGFVIAAPIYLLAYAARKAWRHSPHPGAVAAITVLVAAVTLPSVPRYRFQSHELAEMARMPWAHISGESYAGELTEPITLFRPALASITYTAPSWIETQFQQLTRRYQEDDILSLVDADCGQRTIWRAQPTSDNLFHYLSQTPAQMSPIDEATFCTTDWKAERDAWRTALKQGFVGGSNMGSLF